MSTVIEDLEKRALKQRPRFAAGDRVRVHFQVVEGNRRRTQVFEGIVIKRQGSGARETFTVRKQSFGVGVERTFPLHSPKIEKLEVAARGDVRRAKLYYLRGKVGKSARVAERRWGIEEEMVVAEEEAEAVDAEGVAVSEAEPEVTEPAEEEGEQAAGGQQPSARAEEQACGRWGDGGGGVGAWAQSRRPTPPPTRQKTENPAAPQHPGRAPRARHHRRARARPGTRDPGVHRQAVPDPLRVDGAHPRRRPAGPGEPLPLPLHGPEDRGHRRLPSASGRRGRRRRRVRRSDGRAPGARAARACDQPTPEKSDVNFIKRIVAGPGDTLSVQNGHPVVNGKIAQEDFISPCTPGGACNLPQQITIPPDHYFMMGDNRGSSDDSRFWGPVPRDWIIGKAFATYWPPDRVGIF